MGEYTRELSSIHGSDKTDKQVRKIDNKGIPNHLITLRLVREEVISTGMNELPEI